MNNLQAEWCVANLSSLDFCIVEEIRQCRVFDNVIISLIIADKHSASHWRDDN